MNDKYINPNSFLLSLEKRGFTFDIELKKKYANIYKNFKNGLYKKSEDINEKLTTNEKKLIDLFNILNNFNKDYTIYILIIISLHYLVIRNLFRFILINWNKFKNGFSSRQSSYSQDEIDKIVNKNFNNNIRDINNIDNNKVLDMFVDNLCIFVNNDKVFLLYIVNIMQEYLCP